MLFENGVDDETRTRDLCRDSGPLKGFTTTDRLRRQEAMKTAGRENPNHGVALPRNRAQGAEEQNRSRSIKWAEKQEKFQPKEMCFFLTSTFIELTRLGDCQT